MDGYYRIDEHENLVKADKDEEGATQYRQGYFIGDGTGSGKGRQLFGILLDNWLQNRKKAIFITKGADLLKDTRRDWSHLGGKPEQIIALNDFKQGEEINISEGIIFLTYATLRQGAKGGKISRIDQLINWVGKNWDGCLIFDESHCMGHAIGQYKEGFGYQEGSAQGKAGLKIQRLLPNARVVYSSATGFSEVSNLGYIERLGLWCGTGDFENRDDCINQLTEGGIAAMEIVARDLKALGLFCSRNLSYEGVEYEILEHNITPAQAEVYNQYARAYQLILQNLEKALQVSNAI